MADSGTPAPVSRRKVFNLPNQLSLLRVLLVPAIIGCLYGLQPGGDPANDRFYALTAFVIFVIASLTDWVDGVIARKYNLVTKLGQLLDPLADKLLVLSILVMLTDIGRIPAWATIVLLARETAITGLRGIAGSENVVIAAGSTGKWKTVTQLLAIGFIIMQDVGMPTPNREIGMTFLYASILFALYSGFEYFRGYWRHLMERPQPGA